MIVRDGCRPVRGREHGAWGKVASTRPGKGREARGPGQGGEVHADFLVEAPISLTVVRYNAPLKLKRTTQLRSTTRAINDPGGRTRPDPKGGGGRCAAEGQPLNGLAVSRVTRTVLPVGVS